MKMVKLFKNICYKQQGREPCRTFLLVSTADTYSLLNDAKPFIVVAHILKKKAREHIGGNSDLQQLHEVGKLEAMLRHASRPTEL